MKSKSHFQFKQFSVNDDRAAMKVGTDSVLLGAWVNVHAAKSILDIGTGSGVIALIMAQRSSNTALIDAVEIDADEVLQAKENVDASPWPSKVSVHCINILEFGHAIMYDVIVSNPPYFINSQKSPDGRRSVARHTSHLTYEELIGAVKRLLKPEGTFNVVLPFVEGNNFISQARGSGLFSSRKVTFRARAHKSPERLLLEFTTMSGPCVEEEIILYRDGDHWSDAYRELTQSLYLDRR